MDNFLYSTYVTLSSNNSLNYFPENTTSSFKNILNGWISTSSGPLEVALCDLFYVPKSPPESFIFEKNTKDNIILVEGRFIAMYFVHRKEDEVFLETWNRLSDILNKYTKDYSVFLQSKGKQWHLGVENRNEEGFKMIFEENYATAFGFQTTEFSKGKYLSANPVSQALLDKIDFTDPVKITIQKSKPFIGSLEEPVEKTVNGVVNSINKCLSSLNIKFTYENNSLSATGLSSKNYYLKFSPFLCKLFGINIDFWFSPTKISIPSVANIEVAHGKDHLLVLCDLARNQYVN